MKIVYQNIFFLFPSSFNQLQQTEYLTYHSKLVLLLLILKYILLNFIFTMYNFNL